MGHIVYFILTFLIIYMVYYFTSIRKVKKDKKKLPIEIQYLMFRYDLDMKKISYRNLLNSVAIVGSFDIALLVTILGLINGLIWQLLFGFILIIPIIVVSFMVLGRYYQKKQNSVISNDNNKKNKRKKEK